MLEPNVELSVETYLNAVQVCTLFMDDVHQLPARRRLAVLVEWFEHIACTATDRREKVAQFKLILNKLYAEKDKALAHLCDNNPTRVLDIQKRLRSALYDIKHLVSDRPFGPVGQAQEGYDNLDCFVLNERFFDRDMDEATHFLGKAFAIAHNVVNVYNGSHRDEACKAYARVEAKISMIEAEQTVALANRGEHELNAIKSNFNKQLKRAYIDKAKSTDIRTYKAITDALLELINRVIDERQRQPTTAQESLEAAKEEIALAQLTIEAIEHSSGNWKRVHEDTVQLYKINVHLLSVGHHQQVISLWRQQLAALQATLDRKLGAVVGAGAREQLSVGVGHVTRFTPLARNDSRRVNL